MFLEYDSTNIKNSNIFIDILIPDTLQVPKTDGNISLIGQINKIKEVSQKTVFLFFWINNYRKKLLFSSVEKNDGNISLTYTVNEILPFNIYTKGAFTTFAGIFLFLTWMKISEPNLKCGLST